MNKIIKYFHYPLILCCCLVPLITASPVAADAYSWVDNNGHTIYGTKPPKGAHSVSTLKTRKLSKYSSSRVLERIVHKEKNISSTKNKDKTNTRGRLSTKSQTDSKNTQWSFVAAELNAEKPELQLNSSGEVKDCRVFINNQNDFIAADVSVAFEFEDGALIPAVGPSEIAANSSAEFLIPDEFLPLIIESKDKGKQTAAPQVISHGFKR